MDNREILEKAMAYIYDCMAEGWKVEVISTGHFTGDEGHPAYMLELVMEKQ